jgi:Winged helix DNA-binding domain
VLARIGPVVREVLAAGPLPHRELEQRVVVARPRIRARRELLVPLVRISVKWLWESGELLYRNTADSLHRERREFGLTATAHPTLQLNHLTSNDAVTALLRRYLTAFGPAAVDDFQWWSGLTRGDITPAVAALRPELIDVRIGPDPTPLLLLAEDEPQLRAAEPLPSNHVALLAYEDPTLKGYHATRHRYVDDQHRNHLFNTIGEARASIAVAGRYVGTWQFQRSTRTISHTLDAALSPATQRAVVARLDHMIEFLRSEPC